MTRSFQLAGALLLAPILAAAQAMPTDSARFPQVEGKNLQERTMRLPADFAGERNLVLIAFQRAQQADVDTWMPFAQSLASRDSSLRYYELPVLGSGYTIIRGWIDGGMRGGIPDTAARARTITLYIHKFPFRQALGLGKENTIYAVLVDKAGLVLWRASGVYTEEFGAELENVLGLSAKP